MTAPLHPPFCPDQMVDARRILLINIEVNALPNSRKKDLWVLAETLPWIFCCIYIKALINSVNVLCINACFVILLPVCRVTPGYRDLRLSLVSRKRVLVS